MMGTRLHCARGGRWATAAGLAACFAVAAPAQPLRPGADLEPEPEPPLELNPGAGVVPPPHPVIMELYFHGLPRAFGGDANLDGQRRVTGDEFVELMNPHDEPINIGGYQILDGQKIARWRMEWTFPDLTLAPGDRVVVFNGFRQDEIPGADGTTDRAPRMKNPHFAGAWVFSMRMIEPWQAWTNGGDFCLLRAPDGTNVDLVAWGRSEESIAPPTESIRRAVVPTEPTGSYQRLEPFGPMIRHMDIDQRPYSPGEIPDPEPEAATGRHEGETDSKGAGEE